jgi:putative flippase GtrA
MLRVPDRISRCGLRSSDRLREFATFGVVGGACLGIDLAVFQLAYAHLGLGAVASRFASTTVAMTVAYFAHRRWSFSHRKDAGGGKGFLLYAVVTALSMAISLGMVAFVRYGLSQEDALVLQIANVVSTAVSTLLRYVLYRRWVFVEDTEGSTGLAPRRDVLPSTFTSVRPERAAA